MISIGSLANLFCSARHCRSFSISTARSASMFPLSIRTGLSWPIWTWQPAVVDQIFIIRGSGLPTFSASACPGPARKGRKSSCGLHFAATRKNIKSKNITSIIGAIRKVNGRFRRVKILARKSVRTLSFFAVSNAIPRLEIAVLRVSLGEFSATMQGLCIERQCIMIPFGKDVRQAFCGCIGAKEPAFLQICSEGHHISSFSIT